MRWQVEVRSLPRVADSFGTTIAHRLRTQGFDLPDLQVRTARLYYVEGERTLDEVNRLAEELFLDPVTETIRVLAWDTYQPDVQGSISVFKKPGVMDPSEASILRGAARLGLPLVRAATAVRFTLTARGVGRPMLERIAPLLGNPAIEVMSIDDDRFPSRGGGGGESAARVEIPLRDADGNRLDAISRQGGLSLTRLEMEAVQSHFRALGREPTDIELESIAQTWSEHCKHKTLAGAVRYRGAEVPGRGTAFRMQNVLKETIKAATESLDRSFCLSVFHDNAGVIAFEGDQALCFKVETHNHPSAIEPYGGAGTGIGGVIRDILGTGLGARPIANTNVFCVAPLDLPADQVPKGAQHPVRILKGVVSGVRDYGNQMGIPTVNGAVVFDARYVGNPLVYCGTVGLIPTDKVAKLVSPGEAIVALGGRTGRDGIHGATFSSVELHEASERVDSGAVQIGNAITEKKVLDVLLQARDRNLYTAVTDCGAGGFSSAVGEMGEHVGARVNLDRAPLKYAGLSPTEIWISEAQERMVLSVPQGNVQDVLDLCASEDVEATVLGTFTDTGRLELYFEDTLVGDLSMGFLHDGLPRITRDATWTPPPDEGRRPDPSPDRKADLLRLLAHPNVASKEWIIRQYDHEVQAASVVKPLVGTRAHGPSDGAVLAPVLGSSVGFALGLGMNPRYGDIDPYAMAEAAVDEALRNVVCLGADPDHAAILDNFSWGNTSFPDRLGGLVRAACGCQDAALAFRTPFISGKDSLNNEYRSGDATIVIPPSLLISAIARVEDVNRAVTMDLKAPHHPVFLVGETRNEMGGSHFLALQGLLGSGPPRLEGERARRILLTLHQTMRDGWVRACHDLSEGGLGVAAAEMVLAGEVGCDLDLDLMPTQGDLDADTRLWSESLTRFLVEVDPAHADDFARAFADLPCARVGTTCSKAELRVTQAGTLLLSASASELEDSWRPPLGRYLDDMEDTTHG